VTPTVPPPPPKRGGLIVKALIAAAATAGALWVALRDVDFSQVGERLAATDWLIVLAYAGALLVVHAVRVVRWGLLVRPLGDVSWRSVFSAASVGIPAAMFFPLRLGEFVRPIMISRSGIPFAGGLASVVVERVADGLANVGLFFALLAFLPASTQLPEDITVGARIAVVVFGGAVVVLVIIAVGGPRALGLVRRILSIASPALAEKVVDLLATFVEGLKPLARPSRVIGFIVLTAVYWSVSGLITVMLVRSYGIDVPVVAGPFTITVLVFAVMIPAGPAFVGPMQAGFRLGLAPFGVDAASAFVVSTAAHLTQIVLMALVMGVGFLSAEQTQRAGKLGQLDPSESTPE